MPSNLLQHRLAAANVFRDSLEPYAKSPMYMGSDTLTKIVPIMFQNYFTVYAIFNSSELQEKVF